MTKFIQKENFRFKDWIKPGDTVSWSQATSEPLTLTEILVDQRHEVAPLSVFAGTNFSGNVRPLCADSISFVGMGAVGFNRDFLKAGVMEVLPCHLSQIPWMVRSGALKVDALLLQVSVNSNGSFSLGAVSSYLPALIENARTILVEVNDQAPWTFGSYVLDPSRIDVVLQSDRPMIQISAKSPQPIDELIARHVKDLIPDGAILQVGIGNLPGAVMRSLRDHKNLGIHSGVIGDEVLIELIETGVVTNATKKIDQGVSVTGSLFGTDRLYRFAHMNPEIKVERVEFTHNISLISQFECFVTINSALEVDLTGQVNAESIGKNYIGTIGGQTDFVRAALSTQHGRSVVALPSINESSGKSRIVSHLNGPTTTSRADADVIATEWGIAELRGKTIKQRVRAMINIAHPDQRENLDRQAHDLTAGF